MQRKKRQKKYQKIKSEKNLSFFPPFLTASPPPLPPTYPPSLLSFETRLRFFLFSNIIRNFLLSFFLLRISNEKRKISKTIFIFLPLKNKINKRFNSVLRNEMLCLPDWKTEKKKRKKFKTVDFQNLINPSGEEVLGVSNSVINTFD